MLVFALTLFAGVLISGVAHRTVLSTAVLFLVVGFAVGDGALGIVSVGPRDPLVRMLAELALFTVLFTDGMRVGASDLRRAWHLPGRAILLGMPVTLLLTAVLGRLLLSLSWSEAFLIGAVLSPTDPVFAAAIVGREDVPARLRKLLNVESGLNDGLALPIVIVLLDVVSREHVDGTRIVLELLGGVALGIVVPWLATFIERASRLSHTAAYEPLNAFAIGLLVLSIASLTQANEFLAAFAAGITVASAGPEARESFHRFGELVTELFKLAALMIFGIALPLSTFGHLGVAAYLFVVLALVVARPVAIGLALLGAEISRREWLAAAWFGPKGFASVVYGLFLFERGIPNGFRLFEIVAATITVSIVAHSSTDVLVAHRFNEPGTELG